MHHFLFVLWIFLDAETHDAIERRVNEDERAILIQALKDLVLARFEQPQ
jgi:folate-dependent phosphoribosylglycinamide formyltransferase PurN